MAQIYPYYLKLLIFDIVQKDFDDDGNAAGPQRGKLDIKKTDDPNFAGPLSATKLQEAK